MKEGRKPNILMILTDDQGAWAMNCAGNREVITPNLDRLAAEGIRFDNFFCVSPVCSPARASLLTGRIPSQHGVHDWILRGNIRDDAGKYGYRRKDRPVEYLRGLSGYTDYLAQDGYRCGLSGKWHLDDSVRPQKGFSDWYVHGFGGGSYYHYQVCDNGEIVERDQYVTYEFTVKALEFLDDYSRSARPFYLGVHYTAPHSPWDRTEHPDDIWQLYEDCPFDSLPDLPPHPWGSACRPDDPEKRREYLRGYFTAITAMDRSVGRLLERLEELGLRENTIVIFSGDNGMSMGQHGIWGKGNGTFPLNMYDSAVKVPFIISCPGRIPAGRVDRALRSHYDVFPTLLEYLDIENPEADALPGRSFAPTLRGGETPGNEHVVIFDEYGPVRMIRSREWKYVHRYPYGPHELYDLANDPDEERNLVDEAAYSEVVGRMRGELRDWFARYVDPARDGAWEPVAGHGQLGLCGIAASGQEAFVAR